MLLGLLLSWSVAQAALMQFPAGGAGLGVANAVYLAGVALTLLGHELAQGLIVRMFGARGRTAAAELAAAAAGPAFLLLGSVVLIALARIAYVAGAGDPLIRALAAVASFNIVLGAANLLPALPLDGGRLLRAAAWRLGKDVGRATRIAAVASEAISLIIIAIGLATALVSPIADALMWVMSGVLLLLVARSEADGADAAVAAADLGADRAPVAEPGPSERPLRPLR
jgi:Zn-dependent protease